MVIEAYVQFEIGDEFGGLGMPAHADTKLRWKGDGQTATTIGMVATDTTLSKAGARRLAIAASGGLSKGLRLAHAIFDGDTVFGVSTARRPPLRPSSTAPTT